MRSVLMNVSYRMLGSVADAEDAVQEAYARWYALPEDRRREVPSPTGWLVTTVSRICLDVLRSARARRERYVGPWLPEPVPGTARWTSQSPLPADPADRLTLDESVSMALLIVCESMTPAERVAFILHDVFRYPYAEIAAIVGRSPQACRQLASSARHRAREVSPDRTPGAEHARLVAAFKNAWETGNLEALIEKLDPAATAVTDGGGLVSASLEPITGAEPVASFLLGVFRRQPDLTISETTVNGRPGLLTRARETQMAVITLEAKGGRVEKLWVVRNPEKLSAWRAGAEWRRSSPRSARPSRCPRSGGGPAVPGSR
jgi:RNA polymerase sigma-70 factor (ECF subfamily)